MNLAEQLTTARADLAALEVDTGKLEENVRDQDADLAQLRRDARAGTATFAQVVEQETRKQAAAGMLGQHLQDVANTRALVEELEAAQAEHESVASVRQSLTSMAELAAEYERVAAEAEAALIASLERLHEISRAYKAAQGVIKPAFLQAAAKTSGYTAQDVAQVLSQSGLGPGGQAGKDRVQSVNAALESFADLIGPEHAYEALAVTRAGAFAGAPSLNPTGCPRVAEALAGYVPQGG